MRPHPCIPDRYRQYFKIARSLHAEDSPPADRVQQSVRPQGECIVHRRPRRRGSMLLAVIAIFFLLLAGCGVVDQGLTVPAQPTDAATTTASAGSTQTGTDTATGHASNDAVAQSADRSDGDGSNTAAGDGQDGADGSAERSSRSARDSDEQPPDGDEGTDRDGDDQQPDRNHGTDQVDRDGTGSRDDSDDDSVEPGDTVTRTLRRGDSGAQVRRLQRRLKDLHYWIGPVDGVYGQLTE